MANLKYIYGTMESGKTSKLLMDRYNSLKYGDKILLLKPLLDTKGNNKVVTRTNESAVVNYMIGPNTKIITNDRIDKILESKVIFVDEAQFFSREQIKELWEIAHVYNISVICYGLKADFRGNLFEGSSALIALADIKTELTVRCRCGQDAVFNARKINGKFVSDGDVVAIDGENSTEYVPLCSDCYKNKVYSKERINNLLNLKSYVNTTNENNDEKIDLLYEYSNMLGMNVNKDDFINTMNSLNNEKSYSRVRSK